MGDEERKGRGRRAHGSGDHSLPEEPSQGYLVPAAATEGLVPSDPLKMYLAQLRHLPPLSPEEQQSLAERYHASEDVDSARRLVMSNLRLVVKIAREYHRRHMSLMELIQEGNVGLSEAIKRYDPYRGVKFTSYAQYWIRAMILNYLMNVMQLVRVGSTRSGRRLFYNLQKARRQLMEEGTEQPTAEQIAERLGVTESEVIDVARILDAPAISLEQTLPGQDSATYGSMLADTNAPSIDDEAAAQDLRERVQAALAAFHATLRDERERAIWEERVVAEDAISLQELGERFDVSRERIRQVEKALKDRFRLFWLERVGEEETALLFEES